MIPQTAAAVMAFFVFVAPGVLFEWMRRTRRPVVGRSSFDEAAVVAISSTFFTLAAYAVVAAVASHRPWLFPDVEAWAQDPDKYAAANVLLIVRTMAIICGIACAIAIAWHFVLCRPRVAKAINWLTGGRRMTPHPALFSLLVERVPANSRPYVSALLKDGRQVAGWFAGMDDDIEKGAIVLDGPIKVRTRHDADEVDLGLWQYIVLSKSEIANLSARYVLDE